MQPEWKLHWADHTVLQKLQQIQSAFLIAQIPYSLWPTRMVNELSGDFGPIAYWVDVRHPDWMLLLEGTKLTALHATWCVVPSFVTISQTNNR